MRSPNEELPSHGLYCGVEISEGATHKTEFWMNGEKLRMERDYANHPQRWMRSKASIWQQLSAARPSILYPLNPPWLFWLLYSPGPYLARTFARSLPPTLFRSDLRAHKIALMLPQDRRLTLSLLKLQSMVVLFHFFHWIIDFAPLLWWDEKPLV